MKKVSDTIRNAIIEKTDRAQQIEEIMCTLSCNQAKAKQLFFAYIYHAKEDFLSNLLKEEEK